jgi:N-methylhydantoinase A
VELVNLELIGQGISKQSRVPDSPHIEESFQRELLARQVYFGPDQGWMDVPVVDRGWLNKATDGPCIIEEYDATCLLPPNAHASLDERGNIVIDLQRPSP